MDNGRILDKVLMSVFLGLGALILYCVYFCGPTPENELTLVEDVPRDVHITMNSGRYGASRYLRFRVGAYLTRVPISVWYPDRKSNDPLPVINKAAQNGERVKVWVNAKTKNNKIIGAIMGRDYVELYKLSVGNVSIIAYQDVAGPLKEVNEKYELPTGWVLIALGLFSLVRLRMSTF